MTMLWRRTHPIVRIINSNKSGIVRVTARTANHTTTSQVEEQRRQWA